MTTRYAFWITSSRGTDVVESLVPRDTNDLQWEVENWCNQFAAWYVSENYVRYGYRKTKLPVGRLDRTASRKYIKRYCK